MKVKSKKAKVEFPKLELKTLLKPKLSIKPRANKHNKLGQSMPIVSHKIKTPMNIKITPKASLDNPFVSGINWPTKQRISERGIIMLRKIILSFNLGFIFLFYEEYRIYLIHKDT